MSLYRVRRVFVAVAAVMALPGIASAQSLPTKAPPPPAQVVPPTATPYTLPFSLPWVGGDWTVTVGAGVELKPNFEGSRHSMLSPVPFFSVRRAGTPEQFRTTRDGISFSLFDYGRFRAGPAGRLEMTRDAGRFQELRGLGNVNLTVELGGFAEYYPVDWLRTRVEVLQGVTGHHGLVADFSADVIVPLRDRLTFSAGPRFSVTDTRALGPRFGITPMQAAASGLPAFHTKGGAHSVGVGGQLIYHYDPQWEVRPYVEYDRLLGSAAQSPLVRFRGSANQVTVGIGVSYSFDVRVPE
jgi:MipA family protein